MGRKEYFSAVRFGVPRWNEQPDAALEKEPMGAARCTSNILSPCAKKNCVYRPFIHCLRLKSQETAQ